MVRMQIIDIDYIVKENRPVIRIFGKTEQGKTIVAYDDSFIPYFYILPKREKTEDVIKIIKDNEKIRKIREVKRFLSIGYHKKKETLLQVFTKIPKDVVALREEFSSIPLVKNIYEADILFKYRYMVDKNLHGMDWVEIDGTQEKSKIIKAPVFKIKKIRPLKNIKKNAPLRYLSFDIESVTKDKERMVDGKKDPIIMISLAFDPAWRGKKDVVLLTKHCSGKNIMSLSSEKEMLEKFQEIISDYDPDIITGYNINNFDIPFVLNRLEKNNISKNLGRAADKPAFMKSLGIYQSPVITGRVVADPYQIIKNDPWIKLKRYTLNNVAEEFLNEKKIDIKYTEMEQLWNGKREGIQKFVEYSRKDAVLALRILLEKGLLDKFFELSKISGLLLQDTFGGQTTRVETSFLHKFKELGFVLPTAPTKKEVTKRMIERKKLELKGATVLEPKKGLHTEGYVLVLDFKSLYPSIIRTFNICPTCLVTKDSPPGVKYHKSPWGAKFVDKEVREGVLPKILSELLKTRVLVKKEMKISKGEKKRILNAKQLALKTMANSFYGYTGYVRARLYVMDIANSITAYGRENIKKTKEFIEKNYNVEVIYGDTDSVFVKTNSNSLDDARKIGEKIAKDVTNNLPGYLELEFEKIYKTSLILSKKRYAAWKFEPGPDGWENSLEMKGIETVRRDWCQLVTDVMNYVLNVILKEGNITKALDYVKKVIKDVKEGKVPLEKLTIIKGITKELSSYKGTLPHIELAKKMRRRAPSDITVGSRIGFVIIKGNQMLSKRAEDPEYVKEHNLKIDSDYYIKNQLLPPIMRIFSSVGISKGELFGYGRQANIKDLLSGKKRVLNHKIRTEPDIKPTTKHDKKNNNVLGGWEEFVCKKCKKSYRRMPLSGRCECGGELAIAFHGNVGDKVILGKEKDKTNI